MEEEWIEEELLVYLDYGVFVPEAEITDPDTQLKVIGLDKSTVYSEVNGKVFSGGSLVNSYYCIMLINRQLPGTYSDSLGTNLFFAEDTQQPKSDNVFDRAPDKLFKLQAVSDKVIRMKRLFVEPKEGMETEASSDNPPSEAGPRLKFTVDQTYQEALDKLLKPGTLPPRTVTDVLDNKVRLQRELESEYEADPK